ncbi:conserved hypothetical protein [Crenothrix polyspora]|uniref:PIN domain-containing protein n=1 Tax=Crenothrix polyspora TaxID=360316 RepID=A0A1R4HHY5_9GAMM|nr:hypothetical protein [Crenothrix polyspora]SJM95844.1 conserved hypothetical protein [Crenothrix polyspora]
MIVLADNDIILKLAQCDLLDDLPASLGQEWTDIFITPTAKYQLLPKKRDKALNKCGNEETLARLTAFLEKTQTLPEVQDTSLLTILGDIDGIDDGENFLFAAAAEADNPLLITGDKRALGALLEYRDSLPTVFSTLQNSVIIFETAILLVMRKLGFAIVKQKLLGSPKPDVMLRLALRGEPKEANLVECLCSYSKEVIPLLAFKKYLPPELNQD